MKIEYVYKLITTRHSCRKFSDKKISKENLQMIIDAGLCAPSAMNRQPWYFVVIQDNKVIEELNEHAKESFLKYGEPWQKEWASKDNFSVFYDPNAMIVICSDDNIKYSKNDCCFAVMNMTLMAQSLGIGSCIVQSIDWAIDDSNESEFGVPDGYSAYLSLSLGYPVVENNNKKKIDGTKFKFLNY